MKNYNDIAAYWNMGNKTWTPSDEDLKLQLIIYAQELTDLFLKSCSSFPISPISLDSPLKDDVSEFENLVRYFDNSTNFNNYIQELRLLSKSELIEQVSFLTDTLGSLKVSYSYIFENYRKKTPQLIPYIQHDVLSKILGYTWDFSNDFVRDKIKDFLEEKTRVAFDLEEGDPDGKTNIVDAQLVYHLPEEMEKAWQEKDLLKGAIVMTHEFYHNGDKATLVEQESQAVIATAQMVDRLVNEMQYTVEDENIRLQWELYKEFGAAGLQKLIMASSNIVETHFFDIIADFLEDAGEWLIEQAMEILGWIWGVIQGDFNNDPSLSQIIVGTIISMIPIVDQICDARDLIANLYKLIFEDGYKDFWVWFALVMTAIGLIPTVGSAAKGIVKVLIGAVKNSDIFKHISTMFANKLFREIISDVPGLIAKAKGKIVEIMNFVLEVGEGLIKAVKEFAANPLLRDWADKLDDFARFLGNINNKVGELFGMLDDMFVKAADYIGGIVDDILRRLGIHPGSLVVTPDGQVFRFTEDVTENANIMSKIDEPTILKQGDEGFEEALEQSSRQLDEVPAAKLKPEDAANWDEVKDLVDVEFDINKVPEGYRTYEMNGKTVIARKVADDSKFAKLTIDEDGILRRGEVSNRISKPGELVKQLGTKADFPNHQAHHLVPDEVVRKEELFIQAMERGDPKYNIDTKNNGIFLPTSDDVRVPGSENLPLHSGSHGKYSQRVRDELKELVENHLDRIGKDEISDIAPKDLSILAKRLENRMRQLLHSNEFGLTRLE